MDNKNLSFYNVDQKAKAFTDYFRIVAKAYKSTHILHTMGGDFQFMNARMNFQNMDKVIKYINDRQSQFNMFVKYSTPSQYLQALKSENIKFPPQYDDFMPYADCIACYWTGFFTSRTALKYLVKSTGRYLQSARNLISLLLLSNESGLMNSSNFQQKFKPFLDQFEQVLGVLQHHDGVSGTSQQWVANDYVFQMSEAQNLFDDKVILPLQQEMGSEYLGEKNLDFKVCQLNMTSTHCAVVHDNIKKGNSVLINVYNPYQSKEEIIQVKVPKENVNLVDINNNQIFGDIICSNRTNNNDCDLYFRANLTGFSNNYFKILPFTQASQISIIKGKKLNLNRFIKKTIPIDSQNKLKIKNHNYYLSFCEENNNKKCEKTGKFNLKYRYYPSYQGLDQQSGAYIFRPTLRYNERTQVYNTVKTRYLYRGSVVSVLSLNGNRINYNLVLKNFTKNSKVDSIEIETFVKPIPAKVRGKEIVMKFKVPVNNQNIFYTDSNGMEMQRREKNFRETWKLDVVEHAAANYYPILSTIYIEDHKSGKRFGVLPDRAQGASSLRPGELQVMIQRRLIKDDWRGVREALNEREPWSNQTGLSQQMKHILFFSDNNENSDLHRKKQVEADHQPVIYFSRSDFFQFIIEKPVSPFLNELVIPQKTQIYLIPFDVSDSKFLFRIHNMDQKKGVEFDFIAFFSGRIPVIFETTMTGNQVNQILGNSQIEVLPMQIQTFLVKL